MGVDRPRQLLERTFRSLHIRNYRLYFIAQTVSMSGTWLQSVALSWLVLQLTDSAVALGSIVAVLFGPILVLGPWAGVLADRVDKRWLLIVTQTSAGVFALALGVVTAAGVVQLWMVGGLALLTGIALALDMPARQSFVIEMVGPDEVANASVTQVCIKFDNMKTLQTAGWVTAGVFAVSTLAFTTLLFVHKRDGKTAAALRRHRVSFGGAPRPEGGFSLGGSLRF